MLPTNGHNRVSSIAAEPTFKLEPKCVAAARLCGVRPAGRHGKVFPVPPV